MKIDDYGDENDQKQTNTMPFKSKYTPFRHNYLVKKRTKSTGQGSTPPPPNGQCPFKHIFFVDVVPKTSTFWLSPASKGFQWWNLMAVAARWLPSRPWPSSRRVSLQWSTAWWWCWSWTGKLSLLINSRCTNLKSLAVLWRLLPGPNTGGCRRSPLDTLRSPLHDVPDESGDRNSKRYGDGDDGGEGHQDRPSLDAWWQCAVQAQAPRWKIFHTWHKSTGSPKISSSW